jgi:hypothetical protein
MRTEAFGSEPVRTRRARMGWPFLVSTALGLVVTVVGAEAQAYCRTTTCEPTVEDCSPPSGHECTDKGIELFWPGRCVSFNLQQDAAPEITLDTFRDTTLGVYRSTRLAREREHVAGRGGRHDCAPRAGAGAVVERAQYLGLRTVTTDRIAGAAPMLHAYHLAFCVSGTASLESALAGTPPVVAYRCDALTAAVARVVLRTRFVALPNVLLDRAAFPELLQAQATSRRVVQAAESLRRDWTAAADACAQVRAKLTLHDGRTFGDRVRGELDTLLQEGSRLRASGASRTRPARVS